tara:strand:- start:391 stop:696 length:306 start_codon:yes stop_codon:yes gene_type:complete
MSGDARIHSDVSVSSDLTMDLTSYAGMSMDTAALAEEKEAKEKDDPHAPLKPDDPQYPSMIDVEDEYETDQSSDMDDEIVDGVAVPKKKKKKETGKQTTIQ